MLKKIFIFVLSSLFLLFPLHGRKKKRKKYLPVINYEKLLNKKFIKRKRPYTKFIIIHTSEAGKRSSLRTLSEGKRIRNYWTKGGHANYMIDRQGKVYKILNHRYRADHVGLSMWNGLTNLSSYSVGIELVGFHYGKISSKQYKSLKKLLIILKRIYKIKDKNILTHSQVSYGRPNRWFKRPHRGRKKCAINFIRSKAGLRGRWTYDPDVRARRLTDDIQIRKAFYSKYTRRRTSPHFSNKKPILGKKPVFRLTNIINRTNSAWSIAGEDYNSLYTLYELPGGKKIRGNKIGKRIGWNKIPRGTKVHLNIPLGQEKISGPIFKITGDFTAWSFAGNAFNKTDTVYFLPNGRVNSGNRIHDWDALPNGTKLIIGFNGPFVLNIKSARKAYTYLKRRFKQKTIVLHFGRNKLISLSRLRKYRFLPKNTKIYIKNKNI